MWLELDSGQVGMDLCHCALSPGFIVPLYGSSMLTLPLVVWSFVMAYSSGLLWLLV